jgi:crotonobetainyl-CoA:carnitine CoA-transferase CaiB-like acyl-CoA transferase
MRVVKVESTQRPDGARRGDPAFYEWLHAGHDSVVLDFASPRGRAELLALIADADVVIESSRPRALAALGVDAEAVLAARPGRVWLSITGHGRGPSPGPGDPDSLDPVAFGDDAAVAGGLVAWDRASRVGSGAGDGWPPGPSPSPVFCGDAIADPLTGLYAALAVVASRRAGGGHLLDVALRAVAAFVAAPAPPGSAAAAPGHRDPARPAAHRPARWTVTGSPATGWTAHQDGRSQPVVPPRPPRPPG